MPIFLQPYKKYAQFSGRASRKEYWTFYVFQTLLFVGLACMLVACGIMGAEGGGMGSGPGGFGIAIAAVLGLFGLVTLVPSIAVMVRRLHDRDLSGWFALLSLIPYIGGIIIIVLLVMPGTSGPNRFGDDPKAIGE